MANNISNYLENKILDHVLNVASYTAPATLYLALYTSDPTDADVGSEVTTAGGTLYARVAVTFDASVSGATQNAALITFPTAGAAWGTITHVGLRDASTAGNLLWHGPLAASKVIDANDIFNIADGDLDISLN